MIDDEVKDEDADLDSVIVGKEPAPKKQPGMAPLPLPKLMTPAEFARHRLTHVPYHPGCPFCIMGRRPNSHHRRRRSKPRTIPHVVADYGFLRSNDDDLITILVVYIRHWRIYFSTVCDVKGPSPGVVRKLAQLFKDTGLSHFTYKSDREPAIRSLLEAASLANAKAELDNDPDDSDLDDDVDEQPPPTRNGTHRMPLRTPRRLPPCFR